MSKCHSDGLMGAPVTGKPVTECQSLGEVFEAALPAFGGAYLRRVYEAMKAVMEKRIPLVIDTGDTKSSLPSTIVELHGREWKIGREGAITEAEIDDALGGEGALAG